MPPHPCRTSSSSHALRQGRRPAHEPARCRCRRSLAMCSCGSREKPVQAPAMPAAMAPIVSVSPPRLALMTAACQGSPAATSSTAKAAGTDSWLATPVPTRSMISRMASFTVLPRTSSCAHAMRAAMSPPVTQCPSAAPCAGSRDGAIGSGAPVATGNAAADGGGDRCGRGDGDRGVVRGPAGFRHLGDKSVERRRRHHDADRRNAHGRAIGVAAPPGLFRRHAIVDGIDGALGRWTQQVIAAARLDVAFPVEQRIDPARMVEAVAGIRPGCGRAAAPVRCRR